MCEPLSIHAPILIMQKLGESLLNPDSSAEEKTYTVRGDEEDSNTTPVPARIREIITRNLADTPTGILYTLNELIGDGSAGIIRTHVYPIISCHVFLW